MSLSQSERIWQALRGVAAAEGVVAPGPQIMKADRELKARIQDLRTELEDQGTDLALAKGQLLVLDDRTQTLDDRTQTLETGKAPLVHTHAIAQVGNLQNVLNALQSRIAALEAKVP